MKHRYLFAALVLAPLALPAAERAYDPVQIEHTLRDYYFGAARRGDLAMLQEFIAAGYALDTRTEKGYTALILAAYHGRAEAVALLMRAGADPCAEDARGNTALMGAIFKGELAIARTLLDAPCRPDQRNKAGQTAAMYAALFGRRELLDALAGQGADLNAADAAGNTPNSLGRGEFRMPPPPVP